jgi:serine/threonine protein kinase
MRWPARRMLPARPPHAARPPRREGPAAGRSRGARMQALARDTMAAEDAGAHRRFSFYRAPAAPAGAPRRANGLGMRIAIDIARGLAYLHSRKARRASPARPHAGGPAHAVACPCPADPGLVRPSGPGRPRARDMARPPCMAACAAARGCRSPPRRRLARGRLVPSLRVLSWWVDRDSARTGCLAAGVCCFARCVCSLERADSGRVGRLRQIIHMDMKSANILLARDLTAKIAVRADVGCSSVPSMRRYLHTSACAHASACRVSRHSSPPDPFRHAEVAWIRPKRWARVRPACARSSQSRGCRVWCRRADRPGPRAAQDVGLARILKREFLTTLQGSAFTFAYAAPEVRPAVAAPGAHALQVCSAVGSAMSRRPPCRCCWAGSAPPRWTATVWVRSRIQPVALCAHAPARVERAGLGMQVSLRAHVPARVQQAGLGMQAPGPAEPCRRAGIIYWELATGQSPDGRRLRRIQCVPRPPQCTNPGHAAALGSGPRSD